MSCIVWGCTNSNIATADSSVHYYVFPKHPVIVQQWIQACGWPPDQIDISIGKKNKKSHLGNCFLYLAQICSQHFDENSYTTEVKIIDYITCYTKVLKYDAVPTLYLPSRTEVIECDPQEELIVLEVPIQNKNLVLTDDKKEYLELQVKALPQTDESIEDKYKKIQSKEQLSTLENCNKTIRNKITTLENNLKRLKEVYIKQIETYKMKDLELSNLHHEYLRTKRSFLSLHDQRMLLSKVFSESQIKILSGKKKIYWSDDDMAVGYTIRHLSNKRCYLYLSKKLNIPLPAVSSIKRWMTLKSASEKKDLSVEDSSKKNENGENE